MKIRKEQMEEVAQRQEEEYAVRMTRLLCERFPKQRSIHRIRDDDVLALVRRGMAQARDYGIIYEDDIQTYLECMVVLGPQFEQRQQHPFVGDLLRDRSLGSSHKARQLRQYLTFLLKERPTK